MTPPMALAFRAIEQEKLMETTKSVYEYIDFKVKLNVGTKRYMKVISYVSNYNLNCL